MNTKEVFRPMTDEEFAAALAEAAEVARMAMIDKAAAGYEPILIVHTYRQQEDGAILPHTITQNLPGFDMALRDALLGNIGLTFGQKETLVRTVFFSYQVWLPKPSDKEMRRRGTPADAIYGNCVVVAGCTLDERAGSARLEFWRDEEERMIPGKVMLLPYGKQADGRVITARSNYVSPFFRGYKAGALGALEKQRRLN